MSGHDQLESIDPRLKKFFSMAMALSLPVLASTLGFVTYTNVTPGFDVAVIFSSLSLFQVRCIFSLLSAYT